MRHVAFRFVVAFVWFVAMVVCIIGKNMSMSLIYGFMFICFAASAVQLLKKEKSEGGNK